MVLPCPKQTMETAENVDQSRDRFYEQLKDKTLLVTGGTGFVGKVLIEKLLRVTDCRKIFVLVRPKKGKSTKERFHEVFGNPLFDLVKKERGVAILKKVQFVSGDVSALKLGLSEDDRNMLIDEIEFIFHCAATIRFDEDLRPAVLLNVRGTKFMLELAKQCKKLLVFCHLSTAYCHLNERILYEKAYPPPADPEAVIRTCELMNNDVINAITPKILENHPNSYAFTKALAEGLVNDEIEKLPVVILRPSIIMPILKEPIPGWTDNINGPMGLLIAAGKGVLRTMYCQGDAYADYVPVDIVANTMIASVSDYLIYNERRIYNITSSAEYKVTFEEIINIGRKVVMTKIPFNGVFWYPGGSAKRSRLLHNLAFFFYQWLPAVVVDILLVALGYKPVLKRVQRRILKGYDVFEYYTNRQWDFNNDGSMAARDLLTTTEKTKYKMDGDGINYEQYFYDCILSARRFILNEPDDTIPSARRHMKVMWWADSICKTLIIMGFFYLIWSYFIGPFLAVF